MFDKLVESTNVKPQGRSKFYLAITAIYGVSLTVLGILTIMWFNPMPAEAYERLAMLTPPPVPNAPPPVTRVIQRAEAAPRNFAPTSIPKELIDPRLVKPLPPTSRNTPTVAGGVTNGSKYVDGPPIFNNSIADESPAPVPVAKPSPTPTPKVDPTPTPTPKAPEVIVSKMISSQAIKKIQPPYPSMAKAVRAAGAVQVQVLISEEGRVISASSISGHPLLRDAAVQAAHQWVFSPTLLNGKAFKASGVLTFNFILN